jgi:putative DNA primase/helicase
MPIDLNEAGEQHDAAAVTADFLDRDVAERWLRTNATTWVPMLFPSGSRDAEGHWRVANISGAAPKKTGSCVIYMSGNRAGDWHDFAPRDARTGGGPFSTIADRLGISGSDLFDEIKRMMGRYPPSSSVEAYSPPADRKQADYSSEIAHILRNARPIAGTLAETYIRARGIAHIPE